MDKETFISLCTSFVLVVDNMIQKDSCGIKEEDLINLFFALKTIIERETK